MKRWLPFPLLWLALVGFWLLLNETLWIGHVLLGGVVAFAACAGFGLLAGPRVASGRAPGGMQRVRTTVALLGAVAVDIVRSNIAVGRIILGGGNRARTAGFVDIPLALRHPTGLAVLACIITATPGTAWARYDAERGVLTMHILDLVDEAEMIGTIKSRYEDALLEIFE